MSTRNANFQFLLTFSGKKMLQVALKETLEKFHANRLFIDSVNSVNTSYSDVLELSVKPEFALTHRNLVFCLTDNHVGGLTGYLALLAAGAVPVMLSAAIHQEQLQTLIAAYEPCYIWLPIARVTELAPADLVHSYQEYSLLSLRNPHHGVHGALALLLGTSGSTGSPKFVRLSHENVWSNAQSIAHYLDLSASEIPITTLPPSYSYGLSIIHSHILKGATIAVTNKTFFDREFWSFLREVNATSMGGVPYHYEMLKKLRFTRMDLPSLRTLTQAGGRMEPELTKEYASHCCNRGMRFFTMYGQSEATARMSYLPPEKSVSKAGSIGIAIPGGKFWLEDEDGHVIEMSERAGELVYAGPNVSMGYASGYDDLGKGDERLGVLRTGDIAKRDAEGDYYIVGRLKRFIKLFGNRINLQDVEKFLHEKDHDVACAGKDDRLEIYLIDGEETVAVQIKKIVAEYLRISLSGIAVYRIQAFPRNESGKIQYGELQPQTGTLLA